MSHKMLLDEVIRRRGVEYDRESMFRLGANSLLEGIVVTDLDDVITYANKGYGKHNRLQEKRNTWCG